MQGKKVLLLGLGVSGRSAAEFLLSRGADLLAVDRNADVLQNNAEVIELKKKGLRTALDSSQIDIGQFDCVVVSPGISQTHPLYIQAKAAQKEILGEIELACRFLKGTFLGITGTNGKTTVTLLVTHVLNQSGRSAQALGNVGTALTSHCGHQSGSDEILVVELSSYQLETMQQRILDAAVLLNVTPDHLDRYSTMDAYAEAKIHIADCLKEGAPFFIEEKCFNEFKHLLSKHIPKTYGYSSDCTYHTDLHQLFSGKKIECSLPSFYQGKRSHDLENIMAAYALCRTVGVTPKQFLKALETFKKPAHRIEFVCTINGVAYYDDSKGTNIDAVIRAVETMKSKEIILIAGGVDKGSAYSPWIEAFRNKVKQICAIGQAAPKIVKDLAHAIPVECFESLQAAVQYAAKAARKGDIVLLSPGCSSFDMFRDYAHRGQEFQRFVKELNK